MNPFNLFEEQKKRKEDESLSPSKLEDEKFDQPLTKDQVDIYLFNIDNPKISLEVKDRITNLLINAWKKGLMK